MPRGTLRALLLIGGRRVIEAATCPSALALVAAETVGVAATGEGTGFPVIVEERRHAPQEGTR
jgi:hypothetical protein